MLLKLIIREIQIKTTIKKNYNEILPHTYHNGYHQISTNNKCWQECGEGESLYAAGKNVI